MVLNENQKAMYKDCIFLTEGLFERKEDPNKTYIHKSEVSKIVSTVLSECVATLAKVYKVTHWTTFADADKLKHNKVVREIPVAFCNEKDAKNYRQDVYNACSLAALKNKLGNSAKFYDGVKFASFNGNPVLVVKLKPEIYYSVK